MTAPAKPKTRRVTRRDAHEAVAGLQDFTYNRSAMGHWWTATPYGGYLSPAEYGDMKDHIDGADKFFVVRSYETPIAVYVPGKGWWFCATKFSSTTTTHQSFVVRGIRESDRSPVAVSGDDRWGHVWN